jgi:hypothetical protein
MFELHITQNTPTLTGGVCVVQALVGTLVMVIEPGGERLQVK